MAPGQAAAPAGARSIAETPPASLVDAGSAHAGSDGASAYAPNNAAGTISSTAAAAAEGAKKASSACAKQCFAKAQQLGFERVAGDSTACFVPYKGKTLSTYDCCDKVRPQAAAARLHAMRQLCVPACAAMLTAVLAA